MAGPSTREAVQIDDKKTMKCPYFDIQTKGVSTLCMSWYWAQTTLRIWKPPWLCWSVKSNLQSNLSCYFKTMSGIRLLRTELWVSATSDVDSGWLVVMELMVTWLCFLSSHHPVGFAGSDLLFPLLEQNITRSNKRAATTERSRNI